MAATYPRSPRAMRLPRAGAVPPDGGSDYFQDGQVGVEARHHGGREHTVRDHGADPADPKKATALGL